MGVLTVTSVPQSVAYPWHRHAQSEAPVRPRRVTKHCGFYYSARHAPREEVQGQQNGYRPKPARNSTTTIAELLWSIMLHRRE